MSSHAIHSLLHDLGLPVVVIATFLQALGVPIPGGTALVAAAIYASTKHGFNVIAVLFCGAGGALGGTTVSYLVGRWRGDGVMRWLARLFRRPPERLEELRSRMAAHAFAVIFVGRFITGVRNVIGLVAGAVGIGPRAFLLASAVATTAWSALITLEYYFAGHAIAGAPTWLQILLVVVGIAATILTFGLMRDRAGNAAFGPPPRPPPKPPSRRSDFKGARDQPAAARRATPARATPRAALRRRPGAG